jgi:Putative zinc- or iron-chelating domain
MLTPDEQAMFLRSADNVRQAAERHLETHRSQRSVVAFVSNLQRGVSRLVHLAIERGVKIACQPGCNHCCSARVEAMAPEVFIIARELAGRPPDQLKHFVVRLRAHAALDSEGWSRARRSECPFLTSGLCAIYDVRPSVCRKAHSLDITKCQAHAPEIPQDLETVVGVEALAKGTSDAYRGVGFDASGHELGWAVLLALSDPSAESRWFSGNAVFVRGPNEGR